MKKTLLILLAACGSGAEAMNLEQTTEEIFMPYEFGMESGGRALRCDDNWEGGTCLVPDKKTLKFYVDPYSCDHWFEQTAKDAVIDVNSMVSPYGWSTQIVAYNGPWTFLIFCETQQEKPSAHTWFTNNQDCHDTSRGELCQTRGGYVGIRPEYIRSKPIFQNATESQQQAYVTNAVRHEIGHLLGLGHLLGNQEGQKLMAQGFPDDLQSDVWNYPLTFDQDEVRFLDCYNPSSGRGDLCD